MEDLSYNVVSIATDALRRNRKVRLFILIGDLVFFVTSIVLFFIADISFIPLVATKIVDTSRIGMLFFGGILGITIFSFTPYRIRGKSVEFYQEKIAKAEERVDASPEKVKPAWDLARVTLEAYFNRNLGQISYIFWLSVVVLIVGFAIIIWGISQALSSPNVVAPAVITAIAGVITEFIGATFLFIYRSTVQQAINYTKTLERINSVGMAMQILDTMPDETKEGDLKSRTKALLVELLVKQVSETSKENVSNP